MTVLCGKKPNTVIKSRIDDVYCCEDLQPTTQKSNSFTIKTVQVLSSVAF